MKATIVLLVARIALLLVRGRSASERHHLIVATFIGLLAVPMLHFTLPPITPEWLPTSRVASVGKQPSAEGTAGTSTVNRALVVATNSSVLARFNPPRRGFRPKTQATDSTGTDFQWSSVASLSV